MAGKVDCSSVLGKTAKPGFIRDIQALTGKVQNAMKDLIAHSNELLEFINNDVVSAYENFVGVGRQYKEDADMLNELTDRISNNIKMVQQSSSDINKALESTAATIEESSAGSQEIARATQVAAEAASEVNNAAEHMAQNAVNLNELVKEFVIIKDIDLTIKGL